MPFSFENALMLLRQKGSPHERAIDQNKQPTKIAAYPNRIYARGKASVQQPFHWRTPRVWISLGA